ncbi:MAG: hypothetical protein EZS28_001413 [Streblomastix strix]|uniref:Uncharacterized protein n=1 Tax=Streblomastix strix TaxID=222440 RepID=A0A5J4X8Z3_9EUKA|nr:MAG: hypothetical protein EZS28_001413 [Streblomastix strix]
MTSLMLQVQFAILRLKGVDSLKVQNSITSPSKTLISPLFLRLPKWAVWRSRDYGDKRGSRTCSKDTAHEGELILNNDILGVADQMQRFRNRFLGKPNRLSQGTGLQGANFERTRGHKTSRGATASEYVHRSEQLDRSKHSNSVILDFTALQPDDTVNSTYI